MCGSNKEYTMEEEFIEVPNFEGKYWVSNLGTVKSKFKTLSKRLSSTGYNVVVLSNGSIKLNAYTHRLVAQLFIPNPLKHTSVNHIDGNKTNNEITNLEWVSPKQNTAHALHTKLFKPETHNLGTKFGKTSKYHNVWWDAKLSKWAAGIRINNKIQGFKRFTNELEAAEHVNSIITELNIDRPLNIFN